MLRDVFLDGVWRRNVATVQLLGLCPLLGVSYNLKNAVGLSIASAFVLIISSLSVSVMRKLIPYEVRLPCFVMIIATLTTVVAMFMEAYLWDLYAQIALFVQIIVTNCMILGRVEATAYRHGIARTFIDAVAVALGFALALIVLGASREGMAHLIPLAQHPVGAFLAAGLLLAAVQFVREFKANEMQKSSL